MKKLLKILGILLLGILLCLILIPIIFKDKIVSKVKTEVNKQVNAKVDFDDVNISLLKNFPTLSLGIENLSITGVEEFQDIPLLKADEFIIGVGLMSAIKSDTPIDIKNIRLQNPIVQLFVTKEGNSNYQIAKETSEDSGDSEIAIKLQKYSIKNGQITYRDHQSNISFRSIGLDHSGNGNFKNAQFDLNTKTLSPTTSLSIEGVPYLSNARIVNDMVVDINLDEEKYIISDANVGINALQLKADGSVDRNASDILLDLSFASRNNDVKELLSLLPALYKDEMDGVESSGSMAVDGTIQGLYNGEKEHFPKFDINVSAKNGRILYPGFSIPLEDIDLEAKIQNKERSLNGTTVQVQPFGFRIGEEFLKGTFHLSSPLQNPTFDLATEGSLDFDKLKSAIPLEDGQNISGQLSFDIKAKGSQDLIKSGAYDQLLLDGNLLAEDIRFESPDQAAVRIDHASVDFDPQKIMAKDIVAQVGNSDASGEIIVNRPFDYLLEDGTVQITSKLSSTLLDLNEWLPETGEESSSIPGQNQELVNRLEAVEMDFDVEAQEVKYAQYRILNTSGSGTMEGQNILLNSFKSSVNGNDIVGLGNLKNVLSYGLENDTLHGSLSIEGKKFDANSFIASEETASDEAEPVELPGNIRIRISTKFDELAFQKMNFRDAKGDIVLSPHQAAFDKFQAKGLGGDLKLNGLFNTKDVDNPAFAMNYDLSNLSIAETYQSVNTFKALAPIAAFMNGVFNSNVSMSGTLDPKSLIPALGSLSLEGILETLDSKITGFKPVDKVKSLFNVDGIKDWTIENTKHYVEVKDGMVIMKEFPLSWEGIDFRVKGSHGFDQDMDYKFSAQIPREKLNDSELGKMVDAGAKNLLSKLNASKLDVELGEMIEADILLGGNILKPTIKIIPKGFSGPSIKEQVSDQVNEEINAAKDSVAQVVSDVKDSINQEISDMGDRANEVIEEEKEALKDEAKDRLADVLAGDTDSLLTGTNKDSILHGAGDKVGEIIGKDGKKKVDSLKNKIGGWNPFKKKKKK